MRSLNVAPIVNNFYRDILKDDRRSNFEAYVLVLLPALFAQIAVFRPIDAEFVSTMSTALSILFGFTFTSLMSTARYSAKDDQLEAEVVRETRLTTAYALLANLFALISIVGLTIGVTSYASLNPLVAIMVSAGVYFLLFHYLLVMLHLMRYLYLLSIGGAFEEPTERATRHNERADSESSQLSVERLQ